MQCSDQIGQCSDQIVQCGDQIRKCSDQIVQCSGQIMLCSDQIVQCSALIAGDNECQTGTHNCDSNAVCSDKYVGFECSCLQGFTGDGIVCTELFPPGDELVEEMGEFTSPSYPDNYQNNLRHTWTIRAPDPAQVVLLEFTEFDLEAAAYGVCRYDSLSVYDGEFPNEENLLGTFCGSDLPDPQRSTGNVMTLTFQTDEQESFPGFKITYRQMEKVALDFKLGHFACVNAEKYIFSWQRCNQQKDCRDNNLGICKVLDYRDVLLPNWVGHKSLEEIRNSVELQNLTQYHRQNTPCHEQFVDYVCTLLFPRCDSTRLVLPCRSWCVEVQQVCGGQVPGLEETFSACNLFHSSQCYSKETPEGRDCFYGNGENYRGKRNIGESGERCEPWSDAARLVAPSLLEEQYNWANLQDSYCRNPYSSPEPWCYVKDSGGSLVPDTCSVDPCEGACESPVNPKNGRRVPVKGSYRAGDRVSFRCNEGYRVTSGEQDAYCLQNGTWSSPPPECQTDGRLRLIEELFNENYYNPAFPPDSGTVIIFFHAALSELSGGVFVDRVAELFDADDLEVFQDEMCLVENVRAKQILSSVVFRLIWDDRRLQWQNSRYSDVDEIRVSDDKLWRPALALANNADPEFEGFKSSAGARVFRNGEVVWDISQIFKTTCSYNARNFPFDNIECSACIADEEQRGNEVLKCLERGQRQVRSSRVNLAYCDMETSIRVDEWNTEWEIKEEEEGNFTLACIKLHMRRDPTYHMCTAIAPSTFLVLLMGGERLGYAMTILLSMIVTLVFITEIVPAEESLPVIAVVVLIYICMMVLWMLFALITISLSQKEGTLPRWARALFLRHLARLLLLGDLSNIKSDDVEPDSISVDSTDKSKQHNAMAKEVVYYFHDKPAEREKLQILHAIKQLLTELQASVKSLREKEKEDADKEEPETDYYNLAQVVDRVCFVTYIVGLVITIPLTFVFTP
ncbi:Carboxylesterase 5A [Branchiostoma belcheri]|nr:Carboxylesterase 5A [Branchiostoma belcheri]